MTFKRIFLIIPLLHADSFHTNHPYPRRSSRPRRLSRTQPHATPDNDRRDSSYESSASSVKGIVSSLTFISNVFSSFSSQQQATTKTTPTPTPAPAPTPFQKQIAAATSRKPPTTTAELQERIRDDYTRNNYLWTGKIDASSFARNCKFTDPTISFEGVDAYLRNVGNLVPVVDFLLGNDASSTSNLLEIHSDEQRGYIETRWNMVGELKRLPWRPRIDVIGRTKFWYRTNNDGDDRNETVQVYFYDETWEIPAGLALLQLVTPAGTIANSTTAN